MNMRTRHTVVVDVETTGVLNQDRIVEVALVVMNDQGVTIDEYDTLVDPQRDVGPTDIHGITASMVSAAPTFPEVAGALASRLEGAVLVAHNLTFDTRMLANEFRRMGALFWPGDGLCTLETTGERLSVACTRFDIPLEVAHRALTDARATAQLLWQLIDEAPDLLPARVEGLDCELNPRTLRREATAPHAPSPLNRLMSATRYPTSDGALLSYLDGLDWALDDLVITDVESEELKRLAMELDLKEVEVDQAHRQYLDALIAGAMKDGIITKEEHQLMWTIARALGIAEISIPEVSDLPEAPSSIAAGSRICFTGTATDADGNKIGRSKLEAAASAAGLQPVRSVTKKSCDLVVAADPASSSGKASKARSYGIPVMSVLDFCTALGL